MNVSAKIFFRQMLRSKVLLLSLTLALLSLTGCSIHFHSWKPATCVSPKTCIECGKVKGETLRHDISKRGVCKTCGETVSTMLNISERSIETPVLYGGVFLRINVCDMRSGMPTVMFPGRYTIYDAKGKTVVAEEWGPPSNSKMTSAWKQPLTTDDSRFIPLKPGNYSVGFVYYKAYDYDDIKKEFVSKGFPFSGSMEFIVE